MSRFKRAARAGHRCTPFRPANLRLILSLSKDLSARKAELATATPQRILRQAQDEEEVEAEKARFQTTKAQNKHFNPMR